jgi:hypothetical protein
MGVPPLLGRGRNKQRELHSGDVLKTANPGQLTSAIMEAAGSTSVVSSIKRSPRSNDLDLEIVTDDGAI